MHFNASSPPYSLTTGHSKLRELSAGVDLPSSGQFPTHRSRTPPQTVHPKDLLPAVSLDAKKRLSGSQEFVVESGDEDSASAGSPAPALSACGENEDMDVE